MIMGDDDGVDGEDSGGRLMAGKEVLRGWPCVDLRGMFLCVYGVGRVAFVSVILGNNQLCERDTKRYEDARRFSTRMLVIVRHSRCVQRN